MDVNEINIIIKSEMIDLVLNLMETYDISVEELQKELEELED